MKVVVGLLVLSFFFTVPSYSRNNYTADQIIAIKAADNFTSKDNQKRFRAIRSISELEYSDVSILLADMISYELATKNNRDILVRLFRAARTQVKVTSSLTTHQVTKLGRQAISELRNREPGNLQKLFPANEEVSIDSLRAKYAELTPKVAEVVANSKVQRTRIAVKDSHSAQNPRFRPENLPGDRRGGSGRRPRTAKVEAAFVLSEIAPVDPMQIQVPMPVPTTTRTVTAEQREVDQKLVTEMIGQFLESSNFSNTAEGEQRLEKVYLSIHRLQELMYSDVTDVLIELTKHEFKNRKHKGVIETLLEVLEARAIKSHVFPVVQGGSSKLLSLQIIVNSAVSTEARFEGKSSWRKKILDIINLAKLRVDVEPVLFNDHSNTDELIGSLLKDVEEERLRKEAVAKLAAQSEDSAEKQIVREYENLKGQLEKTLKKKGSLKEVKAGDSSPEELLLAGTLRFISDEISDEILNDKLQKMVGREDIVKRLLMVMARYKQNNAVLLGSRGAGKTSILELLAEQLVTQKITNSSVTSFLKNSTIIETSTGRISRLAKSDKPSAQADAIQAYFESVTVMQKKLNRRIIIFIDEIHTLSPEQVDAIKPYLDSSRSNILLIGATTSPEFRNSFKHDEAWLSRLQDIAVREFSEAEMFNIFKESFAPIFSRRTNVFFNDTVVKLLVKKSKLLAPDKGMLRAAFTVADDLSNYLRYEAGNEEAIEVSPRDVFEFMKMSLGIPIDTSDPMEMNAYAQKLIDNISKEVFGQERMVREMVDLWMSVLRNQGDRGVRVGLFLGRSGTGKTETAVQLAIKAFGSSERAFIIKATDYKGADPQGYTISKEIGVPGGVRFGAHTSGRLMDWLDDPSKGKYGGIIVIDEAEKAHLDFWIRFMEVFDTGRIIGGDGKMRVLNRHMIILTSNAGDTELFPSDIVNFAEERIERILDGFSEEDLKDLFEKHTKLPDTVINRIDMFSASNAVGFKVALKILQKLTQVKVDTTLHDYEVVVNVDKSILEQILKSKNPLKSGARPAVRSLDRYLPAAVEKVMGLVKYQSGDEVFLRLTFVDGQPAIEAMLNGVVSITSLPREKVKDNVGERIRQPMMCSQLFAL